MKSAGFDLSAAVKKGTQSDAKKAHIVDNDIKFAEVQRGVSPVHKAAAEHLAKVPDMKCECFLLLFFAPIIFSPI